MNKKTNWYAVFFLALVIMDAILFLTGCGGSSATVPALNGASITASEVFSNRAETWTFKNGYGDLTWIDVLPVDDSHTIWHYRKNADRAYWNPGIPQAELYFDLERTASGEWYSTGGRIIMPLGCPWAVPWCSGPVDLTYSVFVDPGKARPYLIIGNSGTVDATTFPDPNPGTLWKTSAYVESGMLVSEQWEGNCLHEKWYFTPGKGMVKVMPLDTGSCTAADSLLVMTRID